MRNLMVCHKKRETFGPFRGLDYYFPDLGGTGIAVNEYLHNGIAAL